MKGKIRIVHIITGLNTGGAETSLYRLIEMTDKERFDCVVISLLPEGPLAERICNAGVSVYSIDMKKNLILPFRCLRLRSLLKKFRPDLVQTWMYHANLLGGVIAWLLGIPVVWGIHHSNIHQGLNKKSTLLVNKLCAKLSRLIPTKIACCAQKALDVHAGVGYEKDKMLVIPNGFDANVFHPDEESRIAIRKELGLAENTLLVGMAGRFDPQKDHKNFFDAAKIVASKNASACFVLCGDGIDWENESLVGMIDPAIRDRVYLLGRRMDMPRIYAALDVFVLSSVGEAFPNVVGEAMACGVPCVVTDVGDAALIVGGTGVVVPPGDSSALARGIQTMLDMSKDERFSLGVRSRGRICDNFDIMSMSRKYECIYQEIVTREIRADCL